MKVRHEETKFTQVTMTAKEFREKLNLPPGLLIQVHICGSSVEITLSNKEE